MDKQNNAANPSTTNDEVTLKELILMIQEWLRFLLSKWTIILIFGVIGGILGLVYALFDKPLYTATTTFVLEETTQTGELGQYAGLASMMGVNLGGNGGGLFTGSNIQDLYQSRSMLQKALMKEIEVDGKKELLINRFIAFNELREEWKDDTTLANIKFTDTTTLSLNHNKAIGAIIENIKANDLTVGTEEENTNIIKVEVKSIDEAFSKGFADQLVATVNDFYIELKTKRATNNLAILQQQTDSVRTVMEGAIYSSAATLDAVPNLNPSRQVLRTPSQRSQFSAESNKVMLAELIKNLELSKMSLRKETPLIQVIDQPVFPLKRERFGLVKGMIIGGFLFAFFTAFFLSLKMKYAAIMKR